MLSAETSVGKFPYRAVQAMTKIAKRAERYLEHQKMAGRRRDAASKDGLPVDDAIADAATATARRLNAKAIIAFTTSGSTAARVAAYRPETPILALTPDIGAGANLALRWGIIQVVGKKHTNIQDIFTEASKLAIETKIAKEGDTVVAVAGLPSGVSGTTNMLRVITLPEPLHHS